MRLAITGATGFVGGHLIARATAAGHQVRALTRRMQEPREGVTWVPGALDDPAGLAALCVDAEAVIHVAGVVNAADRAGFAAGNVAGTIAMLGAATAAGVRRFVHVSSLAAREPGLSDYGWSKAESEAAVAATALAWTIVRPPAVYGPGEQEILELFRMARRGIVPLPPGGRLSVIHAGDLSELLLAAAAGAGIGATWEPDDGRPGGWTHGEFARAIGVAVGRRVLPLPLPAILLSLGSRVDRALHGDAAKLTPDRVRYFCHSDWVASSARHPPETIWHARITTPDGLAETAAWYREQRLI